MTFEPALRDALELAGVQASASQIDDFRRHFELLTRWNARMNLTAIRKPAEVARRHFGESAFLHRALPEAASFVDVGSGAGFPGLPLATLRPEARVTLLESKGRKAAFLREASRGIPNACVAHCRLRDWRGRAEWAVLRAVAPASVLEDLPERVERVAILGTDRPPDGAFRDWKGRAMRPSRSGRLWTAARRERSRCFT